MNFITLADTATKSTQQQGGWAYYLQLIIMFALIIGVFYFLMIRPQKKRQKEEEKMRNSLQIGDEIVTIGGISGRVVSIKDDSIVLESPADHSKTRIMRWAIQSNTTAHEDDSAKAGKK